MLPWNITFKSSLMQNWAIGLFRVYSVLLCVLFGITFSVVSNVLANLGEGKIQLGHNQDLVIFYQFARGKRHIDFVKIQPPTKNVKMIFFMAIGIWMSPLKVHSQVWDIFWQLKALYIFISP